MKLLKTLMILSVLLTTGCIKDDMDKCPYNTMLTFRYCGDQTTDQFAQMIDGVTLYVFSNDGRLVTSQNLSQAELRTYQGVNLKLDPGKYHFVCWGNAFANTQMTSEGALNAAILQHPNLLTGNNISTNDHLYFGSYDLDLPKNDILSGVIDFASAHINLEIYTKGAGTPTQLPAIEVQNLYPQYDFAMTPVGSQVTYNTAVGYDVPKAVAAAKLQVLRFANDNPILIDIKDPQGSGQSITVVNLKDFMANNNIRVDGIHEATVSILIEFGDLGVDVVIPDWGKEEIDPEGPGYN